MYLRRSYGLNSSGSSAASPWPALLSSDTIIAPSAGVSAHSAGVIVTGTAPESPTLIGDTNMPWLIELAAGGEQGKLGQFAAPALNFAVPATTSTKLLFPSKPNAWYLKRLFGAPNVVMHGCPAAQKLLDRTGRSTVLPSLGAVAKNASAPGADGLIGKTAVTITPLEVPVVSAPWSAPTRT